MGTHMSYNHWKPFLELGMNVQTGLDNETATLIDPETERTAQVSCVNGKYLITFECGMSKTISNIEEFGSEQLRLLINLKREFGN